MTNEPFKPQVFADRNTSRTPQCICPHDDGFDIPGCVRISPSCLLHGIGEQPKDAKRRA